MENMLFFRKNQSFKEQKLKRVILSKLSDVSEDNISTIINFIDIDKQYCVKATRKAQKFLNIVAEENVCDNDESFKSSCQIIYGEVAPGRFENIYGKKYVVSGNMDESCPAAALKTVVTIKENNLEVVEQLLIVYEPLLKVSGLTGTE